MVDLIAKRYVKALLIGRDTDSITNVYNELKEISSAFLSDKFVSIISSTEIKTEAKTDLIISFVENISVVTKNLIKVLGENKRLDIIPYIVVELKVQVALLSNKYEGLVYTNSALSPEYITSIEEKFSKKFDVNLKLTQEVCDYDGIKVDIEGLGLEISFSKARLKAQLIDHILKAV